MNLRTIIILLASGFLSVISHYFRKLISTIIILLVFGFLSVVIYVYFPNTLKQLEETVKQLEAKAKDTI